jgi:DNA repair photolyase
MQEKLSVKSNAVELLEKQLHLRAKKNQYGIIVLSSATDPYLQFEKDLGLTRQVLQVILKYKFPVHVITKSDLVMRDFDLLEQINHAAILPSELQNLLKQKVFITFSFSTINDDIAKIFEPGATPPSRRLQILQSAVAKNFLSGVSMMPLLPYITDTGQHLEQMFSMFKQANAKYIFPASITLFGSSPADSKTLVLRAVEKHYPHLLEKYHRFFSSSNQMPAHYQLAFNKKTKELSQKYGLPNSIL